MNDITHDIIIQAAQGNRESFEAIYKDCSGYVFNVAYRIVGRQEDAQEVTQDVFFTIYKKLRTFRFASSFKTWVYRITVNTAINYVKKVKKETSRHVEFNDEFSVIDRSNEVVNKAEREYQSNKIDALLKMINPDQRACVVLRSIEGLSYKEIAETLNININTVRTRLKRARESLLALRKRGDQKCNVNISRN